jgi:hypothetical protein
MNKKNNGRTDKFFNDLSISYDAKHKEKVRKIFLDANKESLKLFFSTKLFRDLSFAAAALILIIFVSVTGYFAVYPKRTVIALNNEEAADKSEKTETKQTEENFALPELLNKTEPQKDRSPMGPVTEDKKDKGERRELFAYSKIEFSNAGTIDSDRESPSIIEEKEQVRSKKKSEEFSAMDDKSLSEKNTVPKTLRTAEDEKDMSTVLNSTSSFTQASLYNKVEIIPNTAYGSFYALKKSIRNNKPAELSSLNEAEIINFFCKDPDPLLPAGRLVTEAAIYNDLCYVLVSYCSSDDINDPSFVFDIFPGVLSYKIAGYESSPATDTKAPVAYAVPKNTRISILLLLKINEGSETLGDVTMKLKAGKNASPAVISEKISSTSIKSIESLSMTFKKAMIAHFYFESLIKRSAITEFNAFRDRYFRNCDNLPDEIVLFLKDRSK